MNSGRCNAPNHNVPTEAGPGRSPGDGGAARRRSLARACRFAMTACIAVLSATGQAADRQIGVDPMLSVTWGTLTGGPTTPPPTMANNMAAGYWQRSSGAKAGVGSINTGVVEFQLPENAANRIRSATLALRARASQCAGAERVVFEVYGFAGNGRAEPSDATTGVRLASISADCKDNPAFTQPVDVTLLVRQLSVASGLSHVGFSVRKVNHRALASLFSFSAAKLVIVVSDEDLPVGAVIGAAAGSTAPAADGTSPSDPASLLRGLAKAATTVIAGGGSREARREGRDQAAAAIKDSAGSEPTQAPPSSGARQADTGDATAAVSASTGSSAPAAVIAPPSGPVQPGGAAPVNVDIVGLKLGMTLGEVKRALQAHAPGVPLDETRGIVNNVAATQYLSWVIARAAKGAPAGSADAIGVHFAPPPNAHHAIFIERFTGFQANAFPLYDTLKVALIKKFGPPSHDAEGTMLWTFNAAGVQIIDSSVAARCARFPPTDPGARGQNVLFNGYKSGGCGMTVQARYQRGTGPSDRDLVRYLSLSLINDSRFEEMRQRTAQFAAQATRDTASKVAAPKL